MTSKEALENGKARNGFPLNETCYIFTDKELKAIEKDLEKLEYYEKIFKDPLIDIRERLKLLEVFEQIFKKCLVEWHYNEIYDADCFYIKSSDYIFMRVPNTETYGDILREWVVENDKHRICKRTD